VAVIVFEPTLDHAPVDGLDVVNDFDDFISRADLIVANRDSSQLDGVRGKVYTRDLFGDN
jgi:UDPglucose 6-dehydrogenase